MRLNEYTMQQALEIHENGCPDFMNGECDDCGLCEVVISDDALEMVEKYGIDRIIGGI